MRKKYPLSSECGKRRAAVHRLGVVYGWHKIAVGELKIGNTCQIVSRSSAQLQMPQHYHRTDRNGSRFATSAPPAIDRYDRSLWRTLRVIGCQAPAASPSRRRVFAATSSMARPRRAAQALRPPLMSNHAADRPWNEIAWKRWIAVARDDLNPITDFHGHVFGNRGHGLKPR